jgi:uncharacterized repeat protein (TIGR03803 family)
MRRRTTGRGAGPGRSGRPVEPLERRRLLSAYTISALGSFSSASGQTSGSQTDMVFDAHGNLFGTTYDDGAFSSGSITEVAAGTHTLTTVASLTGNDGVGVVGIVVDSAGDVFGVASDTNASGGGGTVFELPAGQTTITPVVTFDTTSPGYSPTAIAIDPSNNLYVLTSAGGATGGGAILEVAANTFAVTLLASLTTTSTAQPNSLTYANGNLYGTTAAGGTAGDGTVFELPAGGTTVNTLGTFDSATTGRALSGSPYVDTAGNVYGVATYGGPTSIGELYEIPAGTTTIDVLAPFQETTTFNPVGNLVADGSGNLYGVTYSSPGEAEFAGDVYRFSLSSDQITVLAPFVGTNGAVPMAGLVADGSGDFFGATTQGGSSDAGVVYEVSPGSAAATSSLTPSVTKSSLPATAVTGAKVSGTVRVTVTNGGTAAATVAKVQLYATATGAIDGNSTLAATLTKKVSIKPGKTATFSLSVKGLALSTADDYAFLPEVTDTAGLVSAATNGPSVNVAAPYVALSATVTGATGRPTAPGKPFSLTLSLTNGGNIDSTGTATIVVYLSDDGTSLTFSLTTVSKPLTIKANGKPVLVHFKLKVPTTATAGNLYPLVTVAQGSNTATAVDQLPVVVG